MINAYKSSTAVLKLPSELRPIIENIVTKQLESLQEKVVPIIMKISDEQDAQALLMLFLQTSLPSGFRTLERDQMEASLLQSKILHALRGHEPIQNRFLGVSEEPTSQSLAEKGPPALSVLRKGSKEASRLVSDRKISLYVRAM